MTTRWKPEWDEIYWFVTVDDGDNEALPTRWFNDVEDTKMHESGNCFKTKEQAELALERIKKVLMEAHDD